MKKIVGTKQKVSAGQIQPQAASCATEVLCKRSAEVEVPSQQVG